MRWEDIQNDKAFQNESLSVKAKVAQGYFRAHIEADEGFKKEPVSEQLRVKANFLDTIKPIGKTPVLGAPIDVRGAPRGEILPEGFTRVPPGTSSVAVAPEKPRIEEQINPIRGTLGTPEDKAKLFDTEAGRLLDPFYREPFQRTDADTAAGFAKNVKSGLLNTAKGIAAAPILAPMFVGQLFKSIVYDPVKKVWQGDIPEEWESIGGQPLVKEVKGLVEFMKMGIPGLDERWLENLFESPDGVVFGKVLARDIARGTIRKGTEVIDAAEAFKAKQATKGRKALPDTEPFKPVVKYKGPERRLAEEVGRLAEERRERLKKPSKPPEVITPGEKPTAELREIQKQKGLRKQENIKKIVQERAINPLEKAEEALKRGDREEAIRLAKLSQEEGVVLELADGPTTEKLVGKASDRAEAIIQKASKKPPVPEKPKLRLIRPEVKGKKILPVQKEFHMVTPEGKEIPKESIFKSESGLIDIEKLSGEPTPKGKKVMELIRERRKDIDKTILESEASVQKLNKLTKKEREAIPFIRQGIFNVDVLKKIGREDLIPIVRNPTKKMLKASREVGQYLEAAHKFQKEYWGIGIGYKENYVTQIWDLPKKGQVPKGFVTRNPFLQKRKIPSFEEGIKLGLKPKTLDIAEIIRVYDQYRIQSAFNARFVNSIQKLTALNEATGKAEPLAMRADRAPEDWVLIDHPALTRAKAIGKTKEEGLILTKVPIKVHPEIAKEVKIIFDKPFTHPAVQAIETVNAFAKKGQLSLSLFHHLALTEASLSSGIGLKSIGLLWPSRAYNAIRKGEYEIYKKLDVSKDAIEHGVTFGALSDIQRGRINKSLESLENQFKDIPVARQLSKGLRKANEIWDKALWDYYHNSLKLYAYEAQVMAEVKGMKNPTPEKITNVKRKTASFVNDSFGGQNWDLSRTFGNPKMKQMMQLILLSPDWTISTLKQAAAPFKGAVKGDPVLLRRGGLFWLRAGLYFNLIVQSVNYYNTDKHLGEGRFTWENDPGHELNMFVGFNKDGTKKYLRMGKQFREVLEWGKDPLHKLGAKLSPTARETMRQLAKSDPGSGFPTPWQDKGFWESLPERAKSVAEIPLPFSLRPYVQDRPTNFMFALPASRGMTNYKTRTLFAEALKARDVKRVQRIYFAALENNLDAETLFNSANARIKADITYDNKKAARKIYLELKDMKPEDRAKALVRYSRRGMLTPEIKKELDKIEDIDKSIEKQKVKAIFIKRIIKKGK